MKRLLRRWLGIKQLEDRATSLETQVFMLFITLEGRQAAAEVDKGDLGTAIELASQQQAVVKGYDRSQ